MAKSPAGKSNEQEQFSDELLQLYLHEVLRKWPFSEFKPESDPWRKRQRVDKEFLIPESILTNVTTARRLTSSFEAIPLEVLGMIHNHMEESPDRILFALISKKTGTASMNSKIRSSARLYCFEEERPLVSVAWQWFEPEQRYCNECNRFRTTNRKFWVALAEYVYAALKTPPCSARWPLSDYPHWRRITAASTGLALLIPPSGPGALPSRRQWTDLRVIEHYPQGGIRHEELGEESDRLFEYHESHPYIFDHFMAGCPIHGLAVQALHIVDEVYPPGTTFRHASPNKEEEKVDSTLDDGTSGIKDFTYRARPANKPYFLSYDSKHDFGRIFYDVGDEKGEEKKTGELTLAVKRKELPSDNELQLLIKAQQSAKELETAIDSSRC